MDASESIAQGGGVGGCGDGADCVRSDDLGIFDVVDAVEGPGHDDGDVGSGVARRSQRRLQAIGYNDIAAGCVSSPEAPLPFAGRMHGSSTASPACPLEQHIPRSRDASRPVFAASLQKQILTFFSPRLDDYDSCNFQVQHL